eukprot:TRINITY_DN710_c0_g1_i2.p2 TRINITY_DN710_c0_g1~~TRINITY_DN710_c0_g1_i2.p2  ORF type:complete len:385 (+),score=69.95 TRINITY_DN710_c0_g1_i2:1410-2564(+)
MDICQSKDKATKRIAKRARSEKLSGTVRQVSESKRFKTTEDSQGKRKSLNLDNNQELNKVIAFEGNIGAGKSTLCGKFKTLYPTNCGVYKEQGNEKFLQLFYSNPKAYGFAFQWGMLKTRQFQLQLAQHDSKYGRVPPRQFYFWDRSMVGDYIFALWNHLLGSISKEEMDVYEDEFGGSIRALESITFLSVVDCYVLLNDEPYNCKYRVENIRGNKSESQIPLPYYEGIDDMHFALFVEHLMPKKIVPIHVTTWGQYNEPKALWQTCIDVVQGKHKMPEVTYLTSLPETLASNHFKYNTESDILEFYKHIKALPNNNLFAQTVEMEEARNRKRYGTIYIPKDIMIIPPEEKGVNLQDYNIVFYKNEYKRVVLWHLSQNQHVIFY